MIAAGYFVGPPIGGALYSIGSFRAPFLVLGVLVALFIPAIMTLYPSQQTLDGTAASTKGSGTRDLASVDSRDLDGLQAIAARAGMSVFWGVQQLTDCSQSESTEKGAMQATLSTQTSCWRFCISIRMRGGQSSH